MFSLRSKFCVTTIVSTLLASFALNAQAVTNEDSVNYNGEAVSPYLGIKHISVTSATKYINVTNGDTVEFDVGGISFTWHFDTIQTGKILRLSDIAPGNLHAESVRIYVAPNISDLG